MIATVYALASAATPIVEDPAKAQKGMLGFVLGVVLALILLRTVGRGPGGVKRVWIVAVVAFVACLIIFPPGKNNPKPLPDNPDNLNPASWLWKEFREDLSGGGRPNQ